MSSVPMVPSAGAAALEAYFAPLAPAAEHAWVSADGLERLSVTAYLTEAAPPDEHVRSVRCIVLRGETVLPLSTADRAHVMPGGRREPGETLLQTLERELLEETGWRTTAPRQIGVVRLRFETDRPAEWPEDSPFYPDFLWLIYTAEAVSEQPELRLADAADEGTPVFLPVSDPAALAPLERSPWAPENRVFLAEAVRLRG